jgi:hypothetical protein
VRPQLPAEALDLNSASMKFEFPVGPERSGR